MKPVTQTLDERNKTHGDFREQAIVSQRIKELCESADNYEGLNRVQKEALDMIAGKISRILNGNPDEPDHWHDIAGYATLVEKDIRSRTPIGPEPAH